MGDPVDRRAHGAANPDGGGVAPREVWYAAYGSNLRRARMDTYLLGGRAPGSHRANPGSRLKHPATRVVTCMLDGRLRFAGHFDVWGSGGGAAFYDPLPGDVPVWCRAYRITVGQLVDVVLQENGVAPARAWNPELQAAITSLLVGRDCTLDLDDAGLEPYDQVLKRTATTPGDGGRIEVVLVARREPLPVTAPPGEYRATILEGLLTDVGLSADDAEAYLRAFGA